MIPDQHLLSGIVLRACAAPSAGVKLVYSGSYESKSISELMKRTDLAEAISSCLGWKEEFGGGVVGVTVVDCATH